MLANNKIIPIYKKLSVYHSEISQIEFDKVVREQIEKRLDLNIWYATYCHLNRGIVDNLCSGIRDQMLEEFKTK